MLTDIGNMNINFDLTNLEDLQKLQAIAMAFTSSSQDIHSSAANTGLPVMYNQSYQIIDMIEEDLVYMAKRNIGEGSVFYNETRKCWQVAFSMGYDETGKRKRKILSAKSEADAWKAYHDFVSKIGILPSQSGGEMVREIKAQDVTLAQVFDKYISGELDKSSRGLCTKLNSCKPILEKFGDTPIKNISHGDIKIFLARLTNTTRNGKRYGQDYLNKVHLYLKCIFKYAVKERYIVFNPMEDIKSPKSKLHTEENEYKALSKIQMETLFNTVTDLKWKAFITIMKYTGLRPEECNGLQLQDFAIDVPKPYIKIQRAISSEHDYNEKTRKTENSRIDVKDLKNEDKNSRSEIKATRNVHINNEVISAVKAYTDYVNQHRITKGRGKGHTIMELRRKFGNKNGNNYMAEDFIFSTDVTGQIMTPNYVCTEYAKYLQSVGLDPKEYNLYRLRHSFCSASLKKLNFNVRKVQILMGDRNPDMIMKVYNAINRDKLREDVYNDLIPALENYDG